MASKSVPPPLPKDGGAQSSGVFGSVADDFFETAGALESGLVAPPEEGTWMLQGRRKIARHMKRSLPAVIVAGAGLFLVLVLLVVQAFS